MSDQIIDSDEIPEALFEEISQHLYQFMIAMACVDTRAESKEPLQLAGSGTVVEVNGKTAVLTSGHVWNELR